MIIVVIKNIIRGFDVYRYRMLIIYQNLSNNEVNNFFNTIFKLIGDWNSNDTSFIFEKIANIKVIIFFTTNENNF